jgi:hypothetical protein
MGKREEGRGKSTSTANEDAWPVNLKGVGDYDVKIVRVVLFPLPSSLFPQFLRERLVLFDRNDPTHASRKSGRERPLPWSYFDNDVVRLRFECVNDSVEDRPVG